MKYKVYFFIPIILTGVILSQIESELIFLKPINEIKLGTLLFSFPVILALTERFNEVFIVSKKKSKDNNKRKTSLTSFSIGLVLAISGFRILGNFMNVDLDKAHHVQHVIFTFIDAVLTAVVIAGGTDGWHQLVGLLQDITKIKREQVTVYESKSDV